MLLLDGLWLNWVLAWFRRAASKDAICATLDLMNMERWWTLPAHLIGKTIQWQLQREGQTLDCISERCTSSRSPSTEMTPKYPDTDTVILSWLHHLLPQKCLWNEPLLKRSCHLCQALSTVVVMDSWHYKRLDLLLCISQTESLWMHVRVRSTSSRAAGRHFRTNLNYTHQGRAFA